MGKHFTKRGILVPWD